MRGTISTALRLIYPDANAHQSARRNFSYFFSPDIPTYWQPAPGETPSFRTIATESEPSVPFLFPSSDSRLPSAIETTSVLRAFNLFERITDLTFEENDSLFADVVIFGVSRFLQTNDLLRVGGFASPPVGTSQRNGDIGLTPGNGGAYIADRVTIHELGHALGLMHSFEVGLAGGLTGSDNNRFTMMAYVDHPAERRDATELQLYDIAALQRLYGRDDSFRSGNDVYTEFSETAQPYAGRNRFYSIWDGGGTDTIDASGQSTAALIDLRPGFFSSIGPQSDVVIVGGASPSVLNEGRMNISIAFGAYIENARGTSQNDLLIGNLLSNRLEGGGGNDVIYGDEAFDSIHDPGFADYARVDDSSAPTILAPQAIQSFVDNVYLQQDTLLGGAGNDYLHGGRGNDVLAGGRDDDILIGGAGNDQIWGGELNATSGAGDGNDTVSYADDTTPVTVTFTGTGPAPGLKVASAATGIDTLHFIDEVVLTTGNDQFSFTGTIPAGYRLRIDANGGQTADIIDLTNAVGPSITSQIISVGPDEGVKLTSPTAGDGQINLVGFHTTILGSDHDMTTFIGAGTGAVFKAGAAGGDFTLLAGDSAFGFEGTKDIFRVTTTAPAGLTTAEAAEYLRSNRVGIANIGAEDEVWVNGVRFDGNRVTSVIPMIGHYADYTIWSVHQTGQSSYGTVYPANFYEELSYNYGRFAYAPGAHIVRDVSYAVADETGTGLIAFQARTARAVPHASFDGDPTVLGALQLDPLSGTDEMLVIVVNGFSQGDAGMTFTNDYLANSLSLGSSHSSSRFTVFGAEFGGLTPYTASPWEYRDASGNFRLRVSLEYDIVDGVQDGYVSGGGPSVAAGSAVFNFGGRPFGGQNRNWNDYIAGGNHLQAVAGGGPVIGGPGNDRLFGSDANDTLIGGGGDDELRGGAGDDRLEGNGGRDRLYGEAGNDSLGGGTDDDALFGGEGDDALNGNEGNDLLDGGSGNDIASYAGRLSDFTIHRDLQGAINVADMVGSEGRDQLVNIEALYFAGDGSTLSVSDVPALGTAGDDLINGSARNDILFGQDGDDVLNGGSGVNMLYGGLGNDSYVVDITSPQITTIVDNQREYTPEAGAFWAGLNTLILSGVEASDLRFVRQGSRYQDLVVSVVGVVGSITIENQFASGITLGTINTLLLRAVDGSETDFSSLLNGSQFLQVTAGADLQIGTQYDDVLESSAGDDTMIGLDGADIYQVGAGGTDVIDDRGIGTDKAIMPPWKGPPESEPSRLSEDTVAFDFWINPEDIVLTRSGLDLVITVLGSEGSTTVKNQFLNEFYYAGLAESEWSNFGIVADQPLSTPGIERFEFGDGTVWSRSDVELMVNSGTSQSASFSMDTILYHGGYDHSGDAAYFEIQFVSGPENTSHFFSPDHLVLGNDESLLGYYSFHDAISVREGLMVPMIV